MVHLTMEYYLADKENEIRFLILPEVLFFDYDFLSGDSEMNDEELKNNLLFQYKNLLRIITYLPDNLLSLVKDKRLLALGYAESEVKESGYVMPSPHCHPYFELFYIENGVCRFFIKNNMYDMHTGDFMLIPPQMFHYTRYLFGDCKRSVVFFRKNIPLSEDFLFTLQRCLTL